jgi:kynurenine formamidase
MIPLYVDLSQLIHKDMLVWTNYPQPEFSDMKTFAKDGYFSDKMCIAIHVGTHVDVPIHYVEGTASVEQMPVDTFVGDAFVLDVPVMDPDHAINSEEFDRALKALGRPGLKGATLLFATGWDKHLPDKETYLRSCPGFSKELADHLVSLGVKAVGLDTPSLDIYKTTDSPAHRTLLKAGMVGYENLQGITRLVGKKIRFYGLPLKLKGASGSPIRAIAEI